MPNTILVGAQWGDEGKGKIIDVLTEEADCVVRSQGGNNAGHTVIVEGRKFTLHLLPSGLLHAGKLCVIGNGVVMDPVALVREIDGLLEQGIMVTPEQLRISESAHLVLPLHRALDAGRESVANQKIGTTRRGIGPAYADKVSRVGLRVCDLVRPELFRKKWRIRWREYERLAEVLQLEELDGDAGLEAYLEAGARLRPYVTNTVLVLEEVRRAGKRVLFEGAQGTYLDIDHGTYPYVTSSNTTAGGAATGTGVAPNRMDRVIGVLKAYTTRVGEGPFPAEDGGLGDRFHGMGREFGATTGRPRRCGWLDLVMARYACLVNGVDELALTNLDGLDGLEKVRLCVGYELGGERREEPPACVEDWALCRPIYEEMEGWAADSTSAVRRWEALPGAAQRYVERVGALCGVPVGMVSVGPEREAMIRLPTSRSFAS